jgi:hypothetical protein
VSALAMEQALIPSAACLDIPNANQRLWSHLAYRSISPMTMST